MLLRFSTILVLHLINNEKTLNFGEKNEIHNTSKGISYAHGKYIYARNSYLYEY